MDFKNKVLNKDIPIPLYYQLKEILLEEIKQSEEGASFPTELELCKQFDISRPTVRQAVNELVIEGYLNRVKGKGTFISESKIKQDFLIVLESFPEEMQRKGLLPTTKVLQFEAVKADEKVAEALNVPVGNMVVKLRRLRFANDRPIVLVATFLPHEKLSNMLSRDLENESLYNIIEQEYGYKIDLTRDHIVPASKGGISRIFNLQPLCVECNGYKGDSESFPVVKELVAIKRRERAKKS